MPARPAVFLDRDGTINARPAEHDYVRDAADFRWLPGAVDGMAMLAHAGRPLIVVSNQRGISRGLVSEATLGAIERLIQDELSRHGAAVTAFRYCPHALEDHCDCRKPRPGLLTAAAAELGLDLARSWMIGDSEDDVAAGHAAGCRAIRLTDGPSAAEHTAASLPDAARLVVADIDYSTRPDG